MKPVQLAPEAVTELAEAATWYESREPGLGDRFLEEVGGVLPTLGTRPRSFPRLQDPAPDLDIRRACCPAFRLRSSSSSSPMRFASSRWLTPNAGRRTGFTAFDPDVGRR
jgi:hypothetical protein